MKRIGMTSGLVLLLAAGALFFGGGQCQAKRMINKPKFLKENKVYQYDIDGDNKKEKIRIKSAGDEDKHVVTTTVYVDGEKYAKVKEKGSYHHNVALCDLYASRKGMNLLIYGTSDSDCVGLFQVYKLGKKKMTKIAQMKSGMKGKLGFVRMQEKVTQPNDDGAFYIYPDTPVYLNYFGCYYTRVKCKIKGDEIQWVAAKNYPYEYKYTFRLRVNISLYGKADLQSDVTVLKAGTKLTVQKIQPIKRDGEGRTYSLVQVKTAGGKVGWIYDQPIDDYENYEEIFESIPAWG